MAIIIGYARRMQDLALFTRHVSCALASRAPLAEVVGSFVQEADTRTMQQAVRQVATRLEAGAPFSQALEEASSVFPASYRRMVRMGEESQTLPRVMAGMATAMEEGLTIHEGFRRAAVYPLIILTILFLLTFFVTSVGVPKIMDIYSQLGADGTATPFGLTMNTFVGIFFVTLTLIAAAILWLLAAGAGLAWNAYRHGRWILMLPLAGPALRLAETARITRSLGLLLESRIPLNEAVGLLAESTTNGYVRAALRDFEQRLQRGESLGAVFAAQPLFPTSLSVMLASAQERGQLGETLTHLAEYYRNRTEHALRLIKEFFEPLMLFIVGLLVAWLIFALYMPLFSIPLLMGL